MKRWHWLLLVGLCGAVLATTRYIGVAVILLLALFQKSWRDRLLLALPTVVAGVVGLLLFRSDVRQLGNTPIYKNLLDSMFIIPSFLVYLTGGVGIAAITVAVLVKFWKPEFKTPILVTVFYFVGLLAMSVYAAISAGGDSRLLVGGVTTASFVAVLAICWLIKTKNGWPRLVGILALAFLAVFYIKVGVTAGLSAIAVGRGYNSKGYVELVRKAVPAESTGFVVYSNCPWAIWYATGRHTYELPRVDQQWMSAGHPDIRKVGGLAIWLPMGGHYFISPDSLLRYAVTDDAGNPMVRQVGPAWVMLIAEHK